MPETFLPIAQDMPGFNPFFGAWVCQDDLNIMVDVGPANTAGRLVDSMETLGLVRLDYIFLTHIHIDQVPMFPLNQPANRLNSQAPRPP